MSAAAEHNVRKFDSYAGFYSSAVSRNPSNPLIDRIGLRILSVFGLLEDAFRLFAYAVKLNDGSRNPWFGKEVQILTPVVPTTVVAPLPVETPVAQKGELLIAAALRGEVETLKRILPDTTKNELGEALIGAAKNGHFLIVRELLKTKGGEIHDQDIDFALTWAITEHHLAVFRELLSSQRVTSGQAELALNLSLRHPVFAGEEFVEMLLGHKQPDGTLLISDRAAQGFLLLAMQKNGSENEVKQVLKSRPDLLKNSSAMSLRCLLHANTIKKLKILKPHLPPISFEDATQIIYKAIEDRLDISHITRLIQSFEMTVDRAGDILFTLASQGDDLAIAELIKRYPGISSEKTGPSFLKAISVGDAQNALEILKSCTILTEDLKLALQSHRLTQGVKEAILKKHPEFQRWGREWCKEAGKTTLKVGVVAAVALGGGCAYLYGAHNLRFSMAIAGAALMYHSGGYLARLASISV